MIFRATFLFFNVAINNIHFVADNWLNTYIPNYRNADDIDGYYTLRKQLMDQNVYNRSQIKYLSLSGAQNLESIVNTLINDQSISSITSTEL